MPEGLTLLLPTSSQGLSEVPRFPMEGTTLLAAGLSWGGGKKGQEPNSSMPAIIGWGHSKVSHPADVQERLSPRCEGPEAGGCSLFFVYTKPLELSFPGQCRDGLGRGSW